jgi:nitroreductase
MNEDRAVSVADAITSRHSVRAYLKKPVPRATIEEILRIAATAPSGSNMQPWRTYVLTGAALDRLRDAMCAAFLNKDKSGGSEYKLYPDELFEPFLARRRACGWGLYSLLSIGRGDYEKARAYRVTNYQFFGAPVGMVFTIDRRLELGSWLDYGMFLQNIMVAARGFGLHTCPEASIAQFPKITRAQLGLLDSEMVVCGMALGYADNAAPLNGYRTEREPLHSFATFLE